MLKSQLTAFLAHVGLSVGSAWAKPRLSVAQPGLSLAQSTWAQMGSVSQGLVSIGSVRLATVRLGTS